MNCPECQQPLAPSAVMCGFCERELSPPRRASRNLRGVLAGVLALAAIVTFIVTRPSTTASAQELAAGRPRLVGLLAGRTLTQDDLAFMLRQVRGLLRRHGLTINAPVTTSFVPLSIITEKQGPDAMGFTQGFAFDRDSAAGIEMFIPIEQAPVTTFHVMAHELGHCWQLDNRLMRVDKQLAEGFSEWVAWHALTDLEVPSEQTQREIVVEIDDMKSNGYLDYSRGLARFQEIEKEGGSDAVFADMLKTR